MPPATNEEQFRFLISCIRWSNNGRVDFTEVANECNVVSKGAAAKRYERMMRAHGIHPNGGPATPQPLPKGRQPKVGRFDGPREPGGGHSSPSARGKDKGKKTAAEKQAQFNEEMNVDDEELELGDVKEENGDGMGNTDLLTSEERERLVVKVEKDDEGLALSTSAAATDNKITDSHSYSERPMANGAASPRTLLGSLPSISHLASGYGTALYEVGGAESGGYQSFGSVAQSQWSTPPNPPVALTPTHSASKPFGGDNFSFNDYTPRQGTPSNGHIFSEGGGGEREEYGCENGGSERRGEGGSVVILD